MSSQKKQLNTKIQKVGRDIFLVIPQDLIRTLKLNIGSRIHLEIGDGVIEITPNSHRKHKRYTIKKQIHKTSNQHNYSNLSNNSKKSFLSLEY